MIITCAKCHTRYKLDENKVKNPVFKARCSKCDNSFVVRKSKPIHGASDQERSGKDQSAHTEMPKFQRKDDDSDSNCIVITVCNQKGGVGKTTTVLNLGTSLAAMEKRVLLVDFDVQSNLTLLLNRKKARSFFEFINEKGVLSKYIIRTDHKFWLLPSNSKMALLAKKYLASDNFEYMLQGELREVKKYFDYILIDTPPSGDFYTLNSLLASDVAIIPTQCEYLSMNGINHVEGLINVLKEKANHHMKYHVLVSMYEQHNVACKVILNRFKETYRDKMLNTFIVKDSNVQESHMVHMPARYYSEDCAATKQYNSLAMEIVAKYNAGQQALQKMA